MEDSRSADTDRKKWDRIYREKNTPGRRAPQPCRLLLDYRDLLPAAGDALDMASGGGGNALLLAGAGLNVTACDISAEACRQTAELGIRHGETLRCLNDDAAAALATARYDVITVSRFLDRSLTALIIRALRPDGLLFYQTFSVDTASGPTNPAYRLDRNELLSLYTHPSLYIVHYREPSLVTLSTPIGGQAGLIALRRP